MNFETILNWQLLKKDSDHIYSAICPDPNDIIIRQAVGETIEKAVAHLAQSINDQSLYLLFEWDNANATLQVVVTDETKHNDSEIIVRCVMPGIEKKLNNISADKMLTEEELFSETLKYWIKDYLTTCGNFFQYSLIALFHSEGRSKTQLL